MRRDFIHYQSGFPGMDCADSSGWYLYPGESIDFDCLAAPDKRSNAKEMAEFSPCIHSDPFRFFLNLGATALLEPGGFGFLHPYVCPYPVLLGTQFQKIIPFLILVDNRCCNRLFHASGPVAFLG